VITATRDNPLVTRHIDDRLPAFRGGGLKALQAVDFLVVQFVAGKGTLLLFLCGLCERAHRYVFRVGL